MVKVGGELGITAKQVFLVVDVFGDFVRSVLSRIPAGSGSAAGASFGFDLRHVIAILKIRSAGSMVVEVAVDSISRIAEVVVVLELILREILVEVDGNIIVETRTRFEMHYIPYDTTGTTIFIAGRMIGYCRRIGGGTAAVVDVVVVGGDGAGTLSIFAEGLLCVEFRDDDVVSFIFIGRYVNGQPKGLKDEGQLNEIYI